MNKDDNGQSKRQKINCLFEVALVLLQMSISPYACPNAHGQRTNDSG